MTVELTRFELTVIIDTIEDSISRNDGAPLRFYELLEKLKIMRKART